MLPEAIRRIPLVNRGLVFASWLQAKWFDHRFNVQTTGDVPLEQMTARGNPEEGNLYVPVHPRAGKAALDDLPIQDVTGYTFIDLGAGKGRMLFLAAMLPFEKVIGVEFGQEVHDIAVENIRTYRNPAQRCRNLESVCMDAGLYEFPKTPLVVYIFNAFRPALLERIAARIEQSLEQHPRDLILVMVNPENSHLIERIRDLQLLKTTAHYKIFRSKTSSAS